MNEEQGVRDNSFAISSRNKQILSLKIYQMRLAFDGAFSTNLIEAHIVGVSMPDLQSLAKELDLLEFEESKEASSGLIGFRGLASLFLETTLGALFPALGTKQKDTTQNLQELSEVSSKLIEAMQLNHETVPKVFFPNLASELCSLKRKLLQDARAILDGDPAAKSLSEVLLCYPGFYAICVYRIANYLEGLGLQLLARFLAETAHQKTGIDIHPKASIGDRFCIDHGTGIVVGETTIIGNDVKLYHGVTLGGLSVLKSQASKKRHPTIQDNVVIYSNAVILGGDTVIGRNSIIGGNVWLTHSIDPNSIVEQEKQQLSIKVRKSV